LWFPAIPNGFTTEPACLSGIASGTGGATPNIVLCKTCSLAKEEGAPWGGPDSPAIGLVAPRFSGKRAGFGSDSAVVKKGVAIGETPSNVPLIGEGLLA
jgi:hypothetical protein